LESLGVSAQKVRQLITFQRILTAFRTLMMCSGGGHEINVRQSQLGLGDNGVGFLFLSSHLLVSRQPYWIPVTFCHGSNFLKALYVKLLKY
jgi:hypothetical protein